MPRYLAAATLLIAGIANAAPPPSTPVPGTVGLRQRTVAVRDACVASTTVITQVRPGDAPALVAALTLKPIRGLDLDPSNQRRATAALRKFQTWLEHGRATATAAVTAERAAASNATRPVDRVEAMARTVQISARYAEVLRSSEIPTNVRAFPEAIEAYCAAMAEQADALDAQAAAARQACADAAAHILPGWWTPICTP
ncbi:MAG: hypothetical protein IPH80_10400 [Myxococcales bacterium]|nr:hypothetical protein [Myxococcales bacterium]